MDNIAEFYGLGNSTISLKQFTKQATEKFKIKQNKKMMN